MASTSSASSFSDSPSRMAATPSDDLIPIKRVARVLNLHTSTVRKMSLRGDFPPAINIGARKIVFSRYALDAWYRERTGIVGGRFPID